jgi:urease accessory protein
VTTQSATKLYRMEANYATSRLALHVASGAYLEFLPDYLIPYRNARLYTEITLEISDDATLVFSDGLAPGRTGHGESFEYDLVFTRLTATDTAGRLRFTDTVVARPRQRDPRRTGLLGRRSHLGSLYVLTGRIPAAELAEQLHACLQGSADADGAASRLPGDDGAVIRVLADTSQALQAGLYRAWQVVRGSVLGVGVPHVHTIKYGREPLVPERAGSPGGGCP